MDPKQEDAVTACTNGSREYGKYKHFYFNQGNNEYKGLCVLLGSFNVL